MLQPMQRKLVSVTPPGAIVDNASWTTGEVDTAGWALFVLCAQLGATDIAMVAFKATESDTAGSGHTDITGTIFGTSNNDTGVASTLPSATDDNKFFGIQIDLRARKRYLDFVLTAGNGTAGTYLNAWGELWRGQDGPRSAAECGFSQRLIV